MLMAGPDSVRGFFASSIAAWWLFGAGALQAQQSAASSAPPPASQPAVERYTYEIQLPDTGKRIQVSATVQLAPNASADTVVLDLDDAMQVLDISLGCEDTRATARWVRAPGQVKVVIPSATARAAGKVPHQTSCFRLSYAGVPTDGLIITTDAKGRWQAFGDNFPNRARHWLACVDHPSRKAKVTFEVIAPAGRSVVANGRLVATSPEGVGRARTVWREDRPIPTYGMVIAAGPLAMLDLGRTACGLAEDRGCVSQEVWYAPEAANSLPGQFARAGEIVEFFSRTIGAYPYEKLAHLQSTTRYGGMENPSAIFYAGQLFRAQSGGRRPSGIDDGLIAHETAHQWFGDAVTEREWAHLWLSEGFATFFAALWAQHSRGDSTYARELETMRDQVLRAKIAATHAVIDSIEADPNRLLNENSYQKGGLVLHMLREELGDSAFFSGLRLYFAARRHGNALTQDVQAAFESASGRPLGWFFDQWLRRPGWPELKTSFTWDRATGRVTLMVDQGARFGAYRLTLPVEIVDAAGAQRHVTVALEARGNQSFVLRGQSSSAPIAVSCDASRPLLVSCSAR